MVTTCVGLRNNTNTVGRELEQYLTNYDICLITPKNLPTRTDPATLRTSILDLILAIPQLASNTETSIGTYLNSNHYPVITKFHAQLKIEQQRIQQRWIFPEGKWAEWNTKLTANLTKHYYYTIEEPQKAYKYFTNQ